MKILCLTPWFPPYPDAQDGNFILDSILAMQAKGIDIRTLVVQAWHPAWTRCLHADWRRPRLQISEYQAQLEISKLQHFSLPRNFLRSISLWFGRNTVTSRLRRLYAADRPDVILVHTEQLALMVLPFCQATGTPLITVLHGINTSPRLNTATERNRICSLLRASDKVVLVGEPLRSHFGEIAGNTDNFRIVPNGYREPAPGQIRSPVPWMDHTRFISVSNLHAGKGVDVNLRAFARLLQQGYANWHYTVVGDGSQRQALETQVRESGLQDHVSFLGRVDHARVYTHLAQADVFVLPSSPESFGLAWLEAMACGLLAIAVRGQGPSAYIEHERTGLLVPEDDDASLADCLHQVLLRPEYMQQLANSGQARVRDAFSWKAHAEKLAGVCEEAMLTRQTGYTT